MEESSIHWLMWLNHISNTEQEIGTTGRILLFYYFLLIANAKNVVFSLP